MSGWRSRGAHGSGSCDHCSPGATCLFVSAEPSSIDVAERRMVDRLLATPRDQWRTIRLNNLGRTCRKPSILEQTVRIRGYTEPLRQIAIRDLGHHKPTLLLTNQLEIRPAVLIDRSARRMISENTIADAIHFLLMDALSAAVPLRVGLDMQLTVMASSPTAPRTISGPRSPPPCSADSSTLPPASRSPTNASKSRWDAVPTVASCSTLVSPTALHPSLGYATALSASASPDPSLVTCSILLDNAK